MQPNQQNPYDFITQTPQKKRITLFGGGNSQKSRIIRVAIIGLLIVIVGIVILSVVSNASKANVDTVYKVAAAQLDLIDITASGKGIIRDGQLSTQNSSASIIVTSQNYETMKYLNKVGGKKISKKISPYQVSTYKKTLDDAQKNGNYDEVYTALLANRIDDYRVKLQAAYAASKDTTLKSQLSESYQQLNSIFPAVKAN